MIDYNNPPECIHGFIDRKLRNGRPACPFCRRVNAPTEPRPRRPRIVQPVLDTAMLAAGDDTLDDRPIAPVVPLTTRRRKNQP